MLQRYRSGETSVQYTGRMPSNPFDASRNGQVPVSSGTTAAFFDVDNTMMRGASLFAVARKMYQRRAFTLREVAWFAVHQLRFVTRGESMGDIHAIRDRALLLASGFSVADMVALGDEIYDEFIESKIWPGTLAIADQHMLAGRQVWLVTATPLEVASVMARRLGLSGALGTNVEHVEGVYTGKLVGEILHGQAKASAIRDLAAEQGLELAQCWGYSDSHNDIPLLELVGHPVAINPDGKLRRHASDRNWPIYDFRTGRKAATFGLKAAGISGALWGLWRSIGALRRRP
ncbi:HAD-IB family hydrolase [Paeniglutamicibacter gangotriensis]|uniref:HAD-IB family hydrolase n=2 Tax=Paeniglutamicibacter gangotriensis TaxID=254787 RepID=A0A5B0E6N7_9MICC|nr:HAD-IB family hydrolase [Paeniglutamicibacter gangotriensis]